MKTKLLIIFLGLFASQLSYAVTADQIDVFENGTTMGWQKGPQILTSLGSLLDTTNQPTGGPNGLNDNYLSSISHGIGGFNAGDRQIMYNKAQWSGDYISAGISTIKVDIQSFEDLNFSNDLAIRIAIQGASGTRYGSNTAFDLVVDGQWHNASFDLSDLVLISGTASLTDVLSDVDTLRILSATNGPAWKGDNIKSFLGVDNISAVPLPAGIWLFISSFIALTSFRKTAV